LDFATVIFTEQGRQPYDQPPAWRTRSLCLTVTGWPSYTCSLAPDSLYVAFHHSQGYGGGILTCLHIKWLCENWPSVSKSRPTKIFSRERFLCFTFLSYL
jgi:hypothetical protein